jgi:hypothetical protein
MLLIAKQIENGQAIMVDDDGLAFDLIELNSRDLRPSPIEERKGQLGKLLRPLRRMHTGLMLNEPYEGDGLDFIAVGALVSDLQKSTEGTEPRRHNGLPLAAVAKRRYFSRRLFVRLTETV